VFVSLNDNIKRQLLLLSALVVELSPYAVANMQTVARLAADSSVSSCAFQLIRRQLRWGKSAPLSCCVTCFLPYLVLSLFSLNLCLCVNTTSVFLKKVPILTP
jgi:hypothetical protein